MIVLTENIILSCQQIISIDEYAWICNYKLPQSSVLTMADVRGLKFSFFHVATYLHFSKNFFPELENLINVTSRTLYDAIRNLHCVLPHSSRKRTFLLLIYNINTFLCLEKVLRCEKLQISLSRIFENNPRNFFSFVFLRLHLLLQ